MTTTTTTDRPNGLAVAAVATALFCVVLIYLALQIRAGRDPAIGASQPPAETARPVVVRRIVIRRVVEQAAPTTGGQAIAVAPAGSSSPVAAAPVAAAPAPAPAPVVSGGS